MSSRAEFTPAATALYDAFGEKLSRRHAGEIAASGISVDVARLRGYRTITDASALRILGFADYQCLVPGILIPVWDVFGSKDAATFQFKPDRPRLTTKKRPIKYETPAQSRLLLDVPPICQADLADPKRPLWITEGIKKSDSAATQGLCIVGVMGVWGWCGTNPDGRTALPDWREVALNNERKAFIAFDSDAVTKSEVQQAQRELAAYLRSRGADVRIVRIPPGPDGAKTGLDDYLVAGGDLDDLILTATPVDALQTNGQAAEATIARLAQLAPLKYETVRADEADKLGIRVSKLDSFVADRRETIKVKSSSQPEILASPDPIDGIALVNEIAATIKRYVILTFDAAALVIALWILHTWSFGVANFAPRLAITSPEKRCGKTTLLKILRALTHRPFPTSNVSSAVIYRMIELHHPTLLMDEGDTYMGPEAKEMRGILNSGHDPEFAYVWRCVGDEHEPQKFSTWAPAAAACIGKPWDTLADRSIEIKMRRKLKTEATSKLRSKDVKRIREALAPKCARWAADILSAIKDDPAVPEELNDRAADSCDPLLAIADAIGGDLPQRSRQAVVSLFIESDESSDPSIKVLLLRDMKTLFDDQRKVLELSSEETCRALADMEERPWAAFGRRNVPITQRQLASMLRTFSICSTTVEGTNGKRPKGYKRKDFDDAFARYIASSPPIRSAQAPNPNAENGLRDFSIRPSENARADENTHSSHGNKELGGRADGTAQEGEEGSGFDADRERF